MLCITRSTWKISKNFTFIFNGNSVPKASSCEIYIMYEASLINSLSPLVLPTVMVLLYTVFLYIKYKHNKTGTYIYGRQKKSWKSFQDSLNKKMNLQLRVSTPASGMSGLTLTML